MCPTDDPAPPKHRTWLLGFTALWSADLGSPAASGDKSFGNTWSQHLWWPHMGSQIVKVGACSLKSMDFFFSTFSLWKLPCRVLFGLCPIIDIHKSCECLWDIIWSCSCVLCPQVSSQCPDRAVTPWVRAWQEAQVPVLLPGSTWNCCHCFVIFQSRQALRVIHTDISSAVVSAPGNSGYTQWPTLPCCYSSAMRMVHTDFCRAWPTSSPWSPAGSELLLASTALLWVTLDSTRACLEPPESCFQVGTQCSSSQGSISSECVGLLPIPMLPSNNCAGNLGANKKYWYFRQFLKFIKRSNVQHILWLCWREQTFFLINYTIMLWNAFTCFEALFLCGLKKKMFSASEKKQVIGKRVRLIIKLFSFHQKRMFLRQIVLFS